ncbi:MAG: HD domain-containing protein [Candidatus Odinarchaeota archaeon]
MTRLKPEMHDIDKLIDKQGTGIDHGFGNYPDKLTGKVPDIIDNPAWKAIKEHHLNKEANTGPACFESLVLSIADKVASATSRHGIKTVNGKIKSFKPLSGKPVFSVHKLWNPETAAADVSTAINRDAKDLQWITKIVGFINSNPSPDQYFLDFGQYLKKRAEDATPGSNLTSLWTHSKLSAQFYHFLLDYLDEVDDAWFQGVSLDDIENLAAKFFEKKIKIARITIMIPQEPVRVRDLNVFDVLADVKNEIRKAYSSNVIFDWFNEMLAVFPENEDFSAIETILSRYGFWLETVERVQSLVQPYPDPDRNSRLIKKFRAVQRQNLEDHLAKTLAKVPAHKKKAVESNIRTGFFKKHGLTTRIEQFQSEYDTELENGTYLKRAVLAGLFAKEKFARLVCDLCQVEQATEQWIDEKSGIVEQLCVHCFSIRKRGSRFPKLDKWETAGATRILWIKIELDLNGLINVLEDLYNKYLKSLGFKDILERNDIRLSVVNEFSWDYRDFLSEFHGELAKRFTGDNVQLMLDEFIAVRVARSRDIIELLEIFDRLFESYFPEFKIVPSPLRLGIVHSSIKYPFIQSWRVLSKLEDEIHVSLIGKGEINLTMSQLTGFTGKILKNKTLIHKFTALADISREFARKLLYSRSDRNYRSYQPLRESVELFGFQNALILAKILGD